MDTSHLKVKPICNFKILMTNKESTLYPQNLTYNFKKRKYKSLKCQSVKRFRYPYRWFPIVKGYPLLTLMAKVVFKLVNKKKTQDSLRTKRNLFKTLRTLYPLQILPILITIIQLKYRYLFFLLALF